MNWKPASPDDLIGQARRVAEAQVTKAQRLAGADPPNGSMKLLLYGPPGVGKTSVVEMVARQLTGSPLAIEDFNGREVTVEVVREWMRGLAYGSLFSRWSVRIVNELDRCSKEAQDLLLTYLDRLPPGRALLGTSNLQLDLLTERFQTRFQAVKLLPPDTEELAAFLAARWSVPKQTALQIAEGSGGCVRAALADLESWLDCQT
ncbi:MAG: ATP-binding protein [Verrucomicrobiales bacterium]|nr:ATP-binding protein [Verrucomicrobiales bacterium]MDF1853771.1 ATP-binding protein [Verrucomicrobiales bacterium]